VPANITVTATGDLTEIPMPVVKASDLVDDEIIAWTWDWKPFPVGTSYVIWNARDSRFNLSYITQSITVQAAAASSQSQVSSSASSQAAGVSSKPSGSSGGASSGGGGAINFWLLLAVSLWLFPGFYNWKLGCRGRLF